MTQLPAHAATGGAQRGLNLTGDPAVTWLKSRGWSTTSNRVQVFADAFFRNHHGFARMWLTGGHYERLAVPEGVASLLLVVDGEAEADVNGRASQVGPGGAALISAGSCARVSTQKPVALYEILADPSWLVLGDRKRRFDEGTFTITPDYWSALTGLINQIFASGVHPHDRGAIHIQSAIESLVLAVIDSTDDVRSFTAGDDALLQSLRATIRSNARDVDFNVGALSRLANVSRAHVHRVFAAADSTPLSELRATRVELVRRELARDSAEGRKTSSLELANRAGFRTVSAMRRALQQVGD